jgi:hypothetical protein
LGPASTAATPLLIPMTSAEPRATFSKQRWTAGPLTRQRRLLIRMTMSSVNQCRSYMAHLRCQPGSQWRQRSPRSPHATAPILVRTSGPLSASYWRTGRSFVMLDYYQSGLCGLREFARRPDWRVVLAKQAMMPIGRRIGDLKRYLLSGAPPPTRVWFSAIPARRSPETPETLERSESFEFQNP